nr:flagellar hook-length control protein FliK [uncultured Romboutsia sp.]
MININLSNMVGDSSLSQSKSVSSDSLSTFKDFISEFKLEDENSGTNTNNKEDVDESLILYNLIYTLYEKFNIAEKIDSLTDLENIKSSLNSRLNLNEVENTKNILDAIENLHTSSESNYSLELNNNDMKEIINNINYLINEGRNNSNKINESLNSLIDKIKNQIKDLDKSSQEDSMYENLDTVGILNQSKIDEYKSSKGTSNDIEYLENIVSADDNSYINSFVGINEFNTVYRNSTSNDIPQPVTEIRQEFITEDIIKSVKYMKNSDLEELNVKLNPRNLGEISIKLSKNKEHSNLLITVDDNNILDLVNKNIEDIKKHLNDTDINIKDIVINVKSENENLFSDNLNKEFNQDRRFNQNNSNKNKKNNNQIIEELHNSEHNKDDDNLNILI